MKASYVKIIENSGSIAAAGTVESNWINSGFDIISGFGMKLTGTAPQVAVLYRTRTKDDDAADTSQWESVIADHTSGDGWPDPDAYGEAAIAVRDSKYYQFRIRNDSVNAVTVDVARIVRSSELD